MTGFLLGDHRIGEDQPPYIIAEMSGNHNHSLERALAIVDAAAQAGAHALKLQTYTADTITLNVDAEDFRITDPKSLWYGKHLHALYGEAHTPWDWHEPIMRRCRERRLTCFSSPFDETAVDFLESLNVPAYKIASFECTHLPLIRTVARTGKPLIISTGLATLQEVTQAVATAQAAGATKLVLLKCTSQYPANAADANLATITDMKQRFPGVQAGLSDHTLGVGVAVASVMLGATVIEKHFTLSRAEGGVDSAFSLEPHELRMLVEDTERAWRSRGAVHYGGTAAEQQSRQFRQSVWPVADLPAGTLLTSEHLKICRPGHSLPPADYDRLLGKRLSVAIGRGERLSWDKLVA